MGEIGIFLSLGMPPKAVTKMHNKQFDLVFTFSGVIGVVLSIPFAFAVWSFLTLFLSLYRPYFYDWMAGNFYCHTDLDFRMGDFAVEKYNLLIKGRCD